MIAVLAYILLNAGVIMIFMDNLFQLSGIPSFIGRVLETAAVIFFAIHARPRIRAFSD